jgi:hypothetical protein
MQRPVSEPLLLTHPERRHSPPQHSEPCAQITAARRSGQLFAQTPIAIGVCCTQQLLTARRHASTEDSTARKGTTSATTSAAVQQKTKLTCHQLRSA